SWSPWTIDRPSGACWRRAGAVTMESLHPTAPLRTHRRVGPVDIRHRSSISVATRSIERLELHGQLVQPGSRVDGERWQTPPLAGKGQIADDLVRHQGGMHPLLRCELGLQRSEAGRPVATKLGGLHERPGTNV